MEVFETRLPGVGVRYEFKTTEGDRIGVVVRRDGRRDLVLYDERDPDSCRDIVTLSSRESAALVELLGGTKLTERLTELRHEVEGLAIEWVAMPPEGGLTGRTIGDARIRAETGASVVAVIRGEASVPGPGPDFELLPGDVILVVGSAQSVRDAASRLAG